MHRWYTRPVLFVGDLERALRFYVERLGFEKAWHEADGAGTVCQVNRGECELILCAEVSRRDRARLFVSLTPEGREELQRDLAAHDVPARNVRWGYDCLLVTDPDGNELLFPRPD